MIAAPWLLRACGLLLASLWIGCTAEPHAAEPGARRSAIVSGSDDRLELFEVVDPGTRETVETSIAALVPKSNLVPAGGRVAIEAASYGQLEDLCPDERFASQPAAALCSAVLIDWDLIVTAGHCVHAVPLSELAAVFGYFYEKPGELEISTEDVFALDRVVAEKLDPAGREPRLDYAVIRLARPVGAGRLPVPIRASGLAAGQRLTSAGAGGGVPLKVDSGGAVQDPRERLLDFFVADTDTSRGSSGGGAFDDELALAGVMSRGDADLERTSDGCMVTVHQPDPAGAHEEFTYASHVIEGLCARSQASSLCREDCGDPCVALPPIPPPPAAGNCSIGAPRNASALFLTLLAGTALLRRRAAIARGARSFSSDSR